MKKTLLKVYDLRTYFDTKEGQARSVDGLSYEIESGQTVAFVGESGCGKTVSSLSIMRLTGSGKIQKSSRIWFQGQDLLLISEKAMKNVRGNRISMIFQEPMTSLNPVYTIGNQLSEVFRTHRGMRKKEALDASFHALESVSIDFAKQRLASYPHHLSGGMRQRVMIAMALACRPELLIADEPTTALDVTVQAQILNLILDLKHKIGMSLQLITHNLGVVAEYSDRILVMYAGEVVEEGGVRDILKSPMHPYTQSLLKSIPILGTRGKELKEIQGTIPKATEYSQMGCRFRFRCEYREKRCEDRIEFVEVSVGHFSRCILG